MSCTSRCLSVLVSLFALCFAPVGVSGGPKDARITEMEVEHDMSSALVSFDLHAWCRQRVLNSSASALRAAEFADLNVTLRLVHAVRDMTAMSRRNDLLLRQQPAIRNSIGRWRSSSFGKQQLGDQQVRFQRQSMSDPESRFSGDNQAWDAASMDVPRLFTLEDFGVHEPTPTPWAAWRHQIDYDHMRKHNDFWSDPSKWGQLPYYQELDLGNRDYVQELASTYESARDSLTGSAESGFSSLVAMASLVEQPTWPDAQRALGDLAFDVVAGYVGGGVGNPRVAFDLHKGSTTAVMLKFDRDFAQLLESLKRDQFHKNIVQDFNDLSKNPAIDDFKTDFNFQSDWNNPLNDHQSTQWNQHNNDWNNNDWNNTGTSTTTDRWWDPNRQY